MPSLFYLVLPQGSQGLDFPLSSVGVLFWPHKCRDQGPLGLQYYSMCTIKLLLSFTCSYFALSHFGACELSFFFSFLFLSFLPNIGFVWVSDYIQRVERERETERWLIASVKVSLHVTPSFTACRVASIFRDDLWHPGERCVLSFILLKEELRTGPIMTSHSITAGLKRKKRKLKAFTYLNWYLRSTVGPNLRNSVTRLTTHHCN